MKLFLLKKINNFVLFLQKLVSFLGVFLFTLTTRWQQIPHTYERASIRAAHG